MGRFPPGRILDFVSRVFPFDTLDREVLASVVRHMELAYYPRGAVIVKAGGDPVENLYLIHSGSVRVGASSDSGEECLIDVRGEGDVFGATSILRGRNPLFAVTAREDLLVFLLPAAEFKNLVKTHPEFEGHFGMSLARNIRAGRDSVQVRPGRAIGAETLKEMTAQMRGRLSDLMSVDVLTCSPETTIRQAAVEMTRRGVGSIVVTNGGGNPVGLVTDTDLRARVLAAGLSPDSGVKAVMSCPPLTISPHAYAFEAMFEMTHHGVHHLLVTEADRVMGVISDHDVKVITGSTPVGLACNLDKAKSIEELARFPERIRRVLDSLFRLGGSAEYMMNLLSEFMDRLLLKLFELCENKMVEEGLGAAPVNYCWLALGRAGRQEQAPPFRQDFSLVYADVSPDREGAVREWFIGFARRVSEVLSQWRFSPVPFENLGIGSEWCRGASVWKRTYLDWIRNPGVLNNGDPGRAFDFRALQGESTFVKELRGSLWDALERHPGFLSRLARRETEKRPPLGFFRNSMVEPGGGCLDRLDLESHGLGPLAGAIRILALEQHIAETNTLARLRLASEKLDLDKHLEDDLHEAFSFMTVLWVSRYLETAEAEGNYDSSVNPADLTMVQRKILKDSFSTIAKLQDILNRRFVENWKAA